jgi:glycosyltransferase involved in cell wall biosynthesis
VPVTIAAALIVKDEQRQMGDCLASLAGAVDEIVVVDTGSTDDTVAIARSFASTVLDFAWNDDFAAARNAGLDRVVSDWVLYIDADERLSLPPGATLTDGLAPAEVIAARVQFQPRLGTTPYRELRLFRNRPELRFRHAMHETMAPALQELTARTGGRTVHSPARITHLGYEGDLTAKHRRNLPLLEQAVARSPDRVYYWHHFAETLAAVDRRADALASAADGWVRACGRPLSKTDLKMAALLSFTYARLLRDSGQDPSAVIDQGLVWHPDQRALLFLRARVLVDRGGYEAALTILDRLRFEDGASFTDDDVSYDLGIFGAFAHDLAGVALLRMGRREEAAAAFALATAADPQNQAYLVKAAALASPPPAASAAGTK